LRRTRGRLAIGFRVTDRQALNDYIERKRFYSLGNITISQRKSTQRFCDREWSFLEYLNSNPRPVDHLVFQDASPFKDWRDFICFLWRVPFGVNIHFLAPIPVTYKLLTAIF
jgi:hypothetical protein